MNIEDLILIAVKEAKLLADEKHPIVFPGNDEEIVEDVSEKNYKKTINRTAVLNREYATAFLQGAIFGHQQASKFIPSHPHEV